MSDLIRHQLALFRQLREIGCSPDVRRSILTTFSTPAHIAQHLAKGELERQIASLLAPGETSTPASRIAEILRKHSRTSQHIVVLHTNRSDVKEGIGRDLKENISSTDLCANRGSYRDPTDIPLGVSTSQWWEKILTQADVVIVVLSPEFIANDAWMKLVRLAKGKGKRMIGVVDSAFYFFPEELEGAMIFPDQNRSSMSKDSQQRVHELQRVVDAIANP